MDAVVNRIMKTPVKTMDDEHHTQFKLADRLTGEDGKGPPPAKDGNFNEITGHQCCWNTYEGRDHLL